MINRIAPLILLFCLSFAQQIATTKDGKAVVLFENGTWQYLEKKTTSTNVVPTETQVFITRTGKKYHLDGCKWLKSKIPSTIADAGPPTDWTWRKFLNDAYGEPDEELTEEYLEGHWDLTIADLDKKCSEGCIEEWWWENGIDTTDRVFYYLQDIDLGDELHDQLEWYECPMIGSDYVGVEVRDEETLKKLEKKLSEQGESIRIKVINDWSELD